ncbi:VIT1/CCC1 transporter family protein [Roseixanthobacter glucoisosaccharinicivorans]|uniref:VIT1/CCC1 transporter family protein n=1 Tax=Roseixanthobacter glucoisosaccharinicivorans TaxID=3119923 RepID=UPI0037265BDD
MGVFEGITRSFKASIGEIVFGMEDGTVSIFGLVFGVALTTNDAKTVLIAGATGAAAAAVSMMAGSYLDAESVRDARRARAQAAPAERRAELAGSLTAIRTSLRAAGVAPTDVDQISAAISRSPQAVPALRSALAPDGNDDDASPAAHAFWMFVSDLFAGFTPVIPFALLPMEQARIVSLAVTAALLLALGIGRGLVAKRPVARTALETLSVATCAALAGIAMGHFLS